MQEMQELKEIIENGRINLLPAERVAENILAAGYQKPFTSDLASDTQKAYKEGYEKARENAVKEFAEKLKQAICDNTYPYFDKNGKPVNIWNTDGFDNIDELLKEYEK